MTLRIGRALTNGVTKTFSKARLTFVLLFGLAQFAFIAAINTLVEAFLAGLDLPAGATEASASTPLSLPVSATVAGVLALVVLLALQAVNVVLIRVMAADRQVITRETYTRRMGWVLLNSIVASVVVGLLTMIGFVLLVIPGLFVLVSLLFAAVYIADRDENVLDAIRDSWGLASGNRWQLFGLVLVVFVGFFAVSFPLDFLLPTGSTLSLVASTVLNTVLVVYQLAVITDAYRQLRGEDRPGSGAERARTPPASDRVRRTARSVRTVVLAGVLSGRPRSGRGFALLADHVFTT